LGTATRLLLRVRTTHLRQDSVMTPSIPNPDELERRYLVVESMLLTRE